MEIEMEKSEGPNDDTPVEDQEKNVQEDAKDVDGKRMQCLKQSLDLSLEKFYSSIKYAQNVQLSDQ